MVGLFTMRMKKFVHYGLLLCFLFHFRISVEAKKINTTLFYNKFEKILFSWIQF